MKKTTICFLAILAGAFSTAFAAPIADAGSNQTVLDREGDGAETVVLESSASAGDIVAWEWKEDATVISTNIRCLATFPVGVHTVTLTVIDDQAQSDTDTLDITVNALTGPKQRRNLKDTPTADRFVRPMDLVWPETPGEPDICLWKDDMFAALSISVDDNTVPDHDWWVEICERYGWNMTWFVITSAVTNSDYFGPWSAFQRLADEGFSVQSHTVNHESNDNVRAESEVIVEYSDSIQEIESNTTGTTVMAVGYPYGNYNRDIAALYYISGRGTHAVINKPECTDYMDTKATSSGINPAYIDAVLEGTSSISWLGNNTYLRGWVNAFSHLLQDRSAMESNAVYVASKTNLWIGLYQNVARYGQERDTATLTMTANNSSRISFTLSDEMDDNLFDFPLTVKVKLYEGWENIQTLQDGNPTDCEIIQHSGSSYALVQAVPDQGEIVLTPIVTPTTNMLSQFGITWTFDTAVPYGQYANGDYWVVGPVSIISMTNVYHASGAGYDGCEINPDGAVEQGYDDRLSSYDNSRNKSRPGGNTISSSNPLALAAGSSLVSSVSWFADEPGAPAINAATGTPRPLIRTMAILTCVSNAPAAGSFRPPYCGSDKAVRFNKSQLDYSKLANLDPVATTPLLDSVEADFEGPWVDHAATWIGAYIHPDMHMPNYGQEMSTLIGQGALMLNLDFTQLPGSPSKETLLVRFTQLGIDLAGIADVGGGWPSDGGHMMGRKWPILCAGTVLNDAHMKDVGNWTTDFQEDLTTFYVSQAEVDITHGPDWNPDTRAEEEWPYEVEHIGLPEWGIRHTTEPDRDNLHWTATYREINVQSDPGWILAAHIMGKSTDWNHPPLFDYIDRATSINDTYHPTPGYYIYGNNFIRDMWYAYRDNYSPRWVPYDPDNLYGLGSREAGVFSSFSASPLAGTTPLSVTFTDQSSGTITNRLWDFGDGSFTNTDQLVFDHVYSTEGLYTVSLLLQGPDGDDSITKTNLISAVGPGTPIASFSADPFSGPAPLLVTFTDTSTGTITNRFWDFGDGTTTNTTEDSVTHTYTAVGSSTVRLVVSGPGGISTNTWTNCIQAEAAADGTVIVAGAEDRGWLSSSTTGEWTGQIIARIGSHTADVFCGLIIPFYIPDLEGLQIADAELSVTVVDGGLTYATGLANADVYAVRTDVSDPAPILGDLTNGTLVVDDWFNIDSDLPLGEKTATTDNLTSWLAEQAGTTGGVYVILCVRPDAIDGTYRYASINTADASSGQPTLTLTLADGSGAPAKSNQTITFTNPGSQVTTNTVALSATASSGLPVTFGVVSGSASISNGSNVTFTASGPITLSANQAGDDDYNAAPQTNVTFTVSKATASVSLSNLSQIYDGSSQSATVTTVPLGLTVDVTYDGSSTAPSAVGSYEVTATVSEVMYQGSATGTLSISAPVTVTSNLTAHVDDTGWRSDGSTVWAGQAYIRIGTQSTDVLQAAVLPFWIPSLDGKQVVDAELAITIPDGSGLSYATGAANADVYGVRSSTSSSATTASDYTDGTKVVDDWFNISTNGITYGEQTVSSSNLASWIDGQVGTNGGAYVFITVKPDAADNAYRYAVMNSADASTGKPRLTLFLSGGTGGSSATLQTASSLPLEWEAQYFDAQIVVNPDALAANNMNTIYESYVAGLDPTDSNAAFTVSGDGNALQWNAVSGRVYSVYWTTNLMSGFQCLESNILWPQNSWTSPVLPGAGFYKLTVELE